MAANHSTGTPKASITDREVVLMREMIESPERTADEAAEMLCTSVDAIERIRAYAARVGAAGQPLKLLPM